MVVRIKDWEIDLGELFRRIRSDLRYALAALALLLLLCACGWLVLIPHPVPRAALVVVGPEGTTLRAGRETFSGPGPHSVPAGKITLHIEAPGRYPVDVALDLAAGTTTTITPTLYPRPRVQEIAALPGSRVEAVYLTDDGVRFRTAVTTTVSVPSASGFGPAPARTTEKVETLWWTMSPDGRRERLLFPEDGPTAEEKGRTALARPEGLFLTSGGESRLLLTDTSGIEGLIWWGDDLLLMRRVPTGVALELVSPETPGVTMTVTPTVRFLALLPDLPDPYCLPAPSGRLVLHLPGGATSAFLTLDAGGKVQYLTDVPASPLPWAFISSDEGDLVWATPTPSGWAVYRLSGGESRLLAEVRDLRGLWAEEGEVFYLDEGGRVRKISGEVLYVIEEIDTKKGFALWRRGKLAVLWNGRYYLLSWE